MRERAQRRNSHFFRTLFVPSFAFPLYLATVKWTLFFFSFFLVKYLVIRRVCQEVRRISPFLHFLAQKNVEKKRSATTFISHKRANTGKGLFFENGIQMYSGSGRSVFKSSVGRSGGVTHVTARRRSKRGFINLFFPFSFCPRQNTICYLLEKKKR